MANQEHLDILKQGVKVWNQWKLANPKIRPNLWGANFSRADLSYAHLSGANLSRADLRGADFGSATLIDAHLSRADLRGADLNRADLRSADLKDADLRGADLRGAYLQGSDFSRAYLQDINLTEAVIARSVFADNDLSATRGLETVKHESPSTISVNTLVNSKGQIPESFLRGCGLSDWQIEDAKLYNPSLSNQEINDIWYRIHDLRVRRTFQINPLFISYSHGDGSFVDTLETHLTKQGVRFWRDIYHGKAGKLEKQIDHAIQVNDVVLIVLSKHSTNSDWVEHEVRRAREKEKQTDKEALCPVALDAAWKTCRWPERLREQIMEYNILDFSNWQDDAYFQKMFGKLLEGLNLFYK